MNAYSHARVSATPTPSPLAPSAIERVMRTKGDLRLGVPVVLTSGSQAAIVVAIEVLSKDRLAALWSSHGAGECVLTRHRAQALGLAVLPDAEVLTLALPAKCDLSMICALADPAGLPPFTRADFPAAGLPQMRPGKLIHQAAIALAKSAQLLPAAVIIPLRDGPAEAIRNNLCVTDATEVLSELSSARIQHPVSSASLPMAAHDAGRVHVFRPDDGGTEHYAIEIGTPESTAPVLVRLHSACFTGDVLGSLKCDCGPQLQSACARMAAEGGGVLLYLNQEGRGIGLANKMRAYALQDGGYDTVEANHHLGFNDDERDFRIGSAILSRLGIKTVRLLTNNPAKVAILRSQGIDVVERVALEVGKTDRNAHYLATKAAKSGHLLK